MSKVIVWEYETDIHGLFAPYEDNISNSIEDAYEKDPQDQNVQFYIQGFQVCLKIW